jgi:hypothetical protein
MCTSCGVTVPVNVRPQIPNADQGMENVIVHTKPWLNVVLCTGEGVRVQEQCRKSKLLDSDTSDSHQDSRN